MADTEEARLQADVEKGSHRLAIVAAELPDDMKGEFRAALAWYVTAVARKCVWRVTHVGVGPERPEPGIFDPAAWGLE